MPLADHDDVVKAFPTNRANHPLGVRVLPGRAGRNYRFSDAQCLGLARKSFSINLVSIPNQVPRNCRLRDRQTELQQLAVDPWRTPKRIGVAHPTNQISELCTDQGPTGSAPTLPRPVAPKSLPVPANHRLRPHYQQRMSPARPQLRQENPEDSVHLRQPRPRVASLPHGQLLPKRQVLEREVAVRAKTASQCPNEDSEPSDHDREIADQSAKCKFIAQDDFLEGTTSCGARGEAAHGHVADHAVSELAHGTPPWSDELQGGDGASTERRSTVTCVERAAADQQNDGRVIGLDVRATASAV